MVFIRPTILHDDNDVQFQTNAKYRYIQELQRQMNESNRPLLRKDPRPELPPLPEPPPAATTEPPAADGSKPE